MRTDIIKKVEEYIDKYRVVSYANVKSRFPQMSSKDIIIATRHLYNRRAIKYHTSKDKNPIKILYFSKNFNSNKALTIYENQAKAIMRCLIVLDAFRRHYKITYENLGFYPFVIRFGVELSEGEFRNIQLIFLESSEENINALTIGEHVDKEYDSEHKINRYIVVESHGMLNGDGPKQICKYIPRVRGFAVCSQNLRSADFYSLEELGVQPY